VQTDETEATAAPGTPVALKGKQFHVVTLLLAN